MGRCGAGWGRASGLEFEFGYADAIFDEEDLFGAAIEDREATVFVPMDFAGGGGVAQGCVFEEFDGYVAEGLIAEVADVVGEVAGGECGVLRRGV